MDIKEPLVLFKMALYGFAGDSTMPMGAIDLMVTLGESIRISKQITFLIVNAESSYDVLLGRHALRAFQEVISTYDMKMKFPVGRVVGEVLWDQVTT